MKECKWLLCPICENKTRDKIREVTAYHQHSAGGFLILSLCEFNRLKPKIKLNATADPVVNL